MASIIASARASASSDSDSCESGRGVGGLGGADGSVDTAGSSCDTACIPSEPCSSREPVERSNTGRGEEGVKGPGGGLDVVSKVKTQKTLLSRHHNWICTIWEPELPTALLNEEDVPSFGIAMSRLTMAGATWRVIGHKETTDAGLQHRHVVLHWASAKTRTATVRGGKK